MLLPSVQEPVWPMGKQTLILQAGLRAAGSREGEESQLCSSCAWTPEVKESAIHD